MVLLPQAQNEMFLLQDLRRDGRFDGAREKHRLEIAAAKRLQHLMPAKQLGVEFGESEFVIDLQPRLQFIVRKELACRLPEKIGESRKLIFAHREAGGHLVATEFFQPFLATAERFDQRQALDAATASLSEPVRIERDHDRGPMILSRQSRGDNAEHSRMPVTRSENDRSIAYPH